jgi:hypothetical protein
MEKAAKARERQEAQAASEVVSRFRHPTSYFLILTSAIQDYAVENYGKPPTKMTGEFDSYSRRGGSLIAATDQEGHELISVP